MVTFVIEDSRAALLRPDDPPVSQAYTGNPVVPHMPSTTAASAFFSLRRLLISAGLITLIFFVAAVTGSGWLESRVHHAIVSRLSTSLESTVELGATRLSFFPLRFRSESLTVRHHSRVDVPPLLVIQSVVADLNLLDLWGRVIDRVAIDGMELNIPPRPEGSGPRLPMTREHAGGGAAHVVIRHLTAANTRVAMIPRESGKNPRVWNIAALDMRDIASDAPASFTASLSNPIPMGSIEATGHFGPWQPGDPGSTPLDGMYTFAADLGTIKGVEGHLEAKGEMDGVLDRITTHGDTTTERFRIPRLNAGSLVLKTRYEALVDGTKGDVELTSVEIELGRSTLHAHGVVEGTKGIKGKRVTLRVTSDAVDLADLLTFVTSTAPPAAHGMLVLDTAFDLPRGGGDVLDRLAVDGSFRADQLRFTSHDTQEKIDTLSRSGQGRPKDTSIDDVASRAGGTFVLANGILTFKSLAFDVRGASIRMAGTYALEARAMNLSGQVRLTASASQTQTGFKSLVLKPFDPLLRDKGAGTILAVHVRGTADQPDIGLDLGKTLNPK